MKRDAGLIGPRASKSKKKQRTVIEISDKESNLEDDRTSKENENTSIFLDTQKKQEMSIAALKTEVSQLKVICEEQQKKIESMEALLKQLVQKQQQDPIRGRNFFIY